MGPECDDLSATVHHQMTVPDFARADGDIVGTFDMSDMLAGTFEQQIAAFAQAVGVGLFTPMEARRRMNLPDKEGSDDLLVNSALLPLKLLEKVDVGVGPLAPPKSDSRHWPVPENDPAAAAGNGQAAPSAAAVPTPRKGLTLEQARTLQGRLSRVKSVADIDPRTVAQGVLAEDTVLALVHVAKARGADMTELRQWINAAVDLDQPKELTA
jgi:hypothetical protein